MAEFLLKHLAETRDIREELVIASAATSTEELGSDVYPPARRELGRHGIPCAGHCARQVRCGEYEDWDLILCMDRANLHNLIRIFGEDPEHKIRLLLDYAGRPGTEVADPWYTGDFTATWRDVLAGCLGLLEEITGTADC